MINKFIITLALLFIIANCQFTYNESLSKKLAGFSMQAYCTAPNIPLNNCGKPCQQNPQGLKDYIEIYNSAYNARAIAGYSPDNNAIVFSFRGTTDVTNWVTNLSASMVDFNDCKNVGCKVHSGFFNHFDSIKFQVTTSFAILRLKYPFAKIYITGHSLGAATATLALPHIYWLNGNKQVDAFYQFCSPRVGNDKFSNWLKSSNLAAQFARVTHGQDPVVQNPSSWVPPFFYHTHNEVFYLDFTQPNYAYKLCPNAEDVSCGAQGQLGVDLSDHMNLFGWDVAAEGKPCLS